MKTNKANPLTDGPPISVRPPDPLVAPAPGSAHRPKIICLCGSSRFADFAAVQEWRFAKQGIITLGMHYLPDWYQWETAEGQQPHLDGGHGAELEGVSHILDELHLRKIEMADEIFVVNVAIPGHESGYIGQRTKIEINYAMKLGKPVSYLVEQND